MKHVGDGRTGRSKEYHFGSMGDCSSCPVLGQTINLRLDSPKILDSHRMVHPPMRLVATVAVPTGRLLLAMTNKGS